MKKQNDITKKKTRRMKMVRCDYVHSEENEERKSQYYIIVKGEEDKYEEEKDDFETVTEEKSKIKGKSEVDYEEREEDEEYDGNDLPCYIKQGEDEEGENNIDNEIMLEDKRKNKKRRQ